MGTSPPEADRKIAGFLSYGGAKSQALKQVDREEAAVKQQQRFPTEGDKNSSGGCNRKGEPK